MSEYRPTSTVELPYVAPNSVENYTLEQLMRLANAKIISYDEIATLLNGKFDKSQALAYLLFVYITSTRRIAYARYHSHTQRVYREGVIHTCNPHAHIRCASG